jgi:hypothetical protein
MPPLTLLFSSQFKQPPQHRGKNKQGTRQNLQQTASQRESQLHMHAQNANVAKFAAMVDSRAVNALDVDLQSHASTINIANESFRLESMTTPVSNIIPS